MLTWLETLLLQVVEVNLILVYETFRRCRRPEKKTFSQYTRFFFSPSESGCDCQPSYDFFCHRICPRRDLLRRLVLNGMLNVDGVKAGASQSAGLHPRWSGELCGRDRHSRNTQVF